MEYKYLCDAKPFDLWKMAMNRTYMSLVGIVNVIFTVAMIILTISFWADISSFIRSLLIFGCILFPIIQPLAIYGMSVRQLEDMPRDMKMCFTDNGMHVYTGGKCQRLKWKSISNAIKRKNMIIIMSDDRHGYLLTNRVLGDEKDSFFEFLCSKIKA